MILGDHLDGHIVTGHVDGISKLIERKKIAGSYGMIFSIPKGLNTYIVQKGSVAIDGVSLTVNKVSSKNFEVNIISHTNDNTILGGIEVGDKVNIEIDIIARYAIKAINKYNKIR
jgi:riboflavin synthase